MVYKPKSDSFEPLARDGGLETTLTLGPQFLSRIEPGQPAAGRSCRYSGGKDMISDEIRIRDAEFPMSQKIEIILNGEKKEVPTSSSLEDLVSGLGLERNRIAIELNLQIVTRQRWVQHLLQNGDQVELVHFVGGGE